MPQLHVMVVMEAYSITGPAKNSLECARNAAAEGVATTFVTFVRGEAENQFTKTVEELASEYPAISLAVIRERGAFDLSAMRALMALVERIQPDVMETNAVKSHFLARLSGIHLQAPWVACHHGYTWPTLKMRLYNLLDRWSLLAAKKVLADSGPFREELASFGVERGRIEVVHSAIAANWGELKGLDRRSAEIPEGRKVALIVGRLSREKDHLTLLAAVSRLRIEVRPHLVVVGEGPERPRIEEKIRELELADFVTLAGQQKSAEPWYGLADVAVLSSLSEGSPNALLEAMAAGVPVVATNVGGIPEMVANNESALLVNPRDAEAMSRALEQVLTDSALAERLKIRALKLVRERHDPAARAQRIVSIYRELAGQKVTEQQAVATR